MTTYGRSRSGGDDDDSGRDDSTPRDRGRAKVTRPPRRGATDLIPGPDETTILPAISDEAPQPPPEDGRQPKKRRAVRRHRDLGSAGAGGGRKTAGDWVRSIVRGFGELFITCGLIILLFAAYEIWGKTIEINNHQDDLNSALTEQWNANPEAVPLPGDAMARLYIPKIKSEPFIVVEGINWDDIKDAPGHYPDTQGPGEKGNFAVAGHNLPAIFRGLYDMVEGDKIVVEDAKNFYIYEVSGTDKVNPYAVEVIKPVPGKLNSKLKDAKDAYITLTTCWPWYDNTHRWIVYGKLIDTRPRSEGIPPEALKG